MFLRLFLIAFLLLPLLGACAPAIQPTPTAAQSGQTDLAGIKTYLLDKTAALKLDAAALQAAAARYYQLAETAGFDYAALWQNQPAGAAQAIADARSAWMRASPAYEQVEGIVAGVPMLRAYDVILDAGASGAEDPQNAVPFDLHLADGRTFEQPGNLFGVLESALWGTEPAFKAAEADLDGNGRQDFGEALPDAHLLLAAADSLAAYIVELENAAQAWRPSKSDAFTALVVMIPTMNEYFNSWKSSRFVSGAASTQRDFVAISRLADMQDILGSLQVVYRGIRPLADDADAAQAGQIEDGLADLKAFIADIHTQEKTGRRFSPEDADLLGAEAQNRATALAGQVAQVAAQLQIPIHE
ncbi:MAG: imelysin family protein [Chloroflexota bacterium]